MMDSDDSFMDMKLESVEIKLEVEDTHIETDHFVNVNKVEQDSDEEEPDNNGLDLGESHHTLPSYRPIAPKGGHSQTKQATVQPSSLPTGQRPIAPKTIQPKTSAHPKLIAPKNT